MDKASQGHPNSAWIPQPVFVLWHRLWIRGCLLGCYSSVVSDSMRPRGLQPARLLCPWDSPGKNTAVGCHFFLQGILQTQGSNPDLLHCRQILYCLSHQGSPSLKKKKKLQLNIEIKLPLTPSLLWFMNSAHTRFRKRNVKFLPPLSHTSLQVWSSWSGHLHFWNQAEGNLSWDYT